MEGNVFDVFRVLALVVVWGIPVVLLVALGVFVIAGCGGALGGMALHLREIFRGKGKKDEAFIFGK